MQGDSKMTSVISQIKAELELIEADRQGLIEPVRSEYITLCVNKKTTDFINSILAIINSQQQQGAKSNEQN